MGSGPSLKQETALFVSKQFICSKTNICQGVIMGRIQCIVVPFRKAFQVVLQTGKTAVVRANQMWALVL